MTWRCSLILWLSFDNTKGSVVRAGTRDERVQFRYGARRLVRKSNHRSSSAAVDSHQFCLPAAHIDRGAGCSKSSGSTCRSCRRPTSETGYPGELITAEKKAMQPTQVARTIDRSVVGIMVDFAKALPYYLSAGSNENTLRLAEDSLARTPCYAGQSDRVIFPDQRAREVLREKWGTLDNTL